jgi:hypothetical protein
VRDAESGKPTTAAVVYFSLLWAGDGMRYQSLKWDIKDKRFLAVVDDGLPMVETDVSQRSGNGARVSKLVRRSLIIAVGVIIAVLISIVGFGILRWVW